MEANIQKRAHAHLAGALELGSILGDLVGFALLLAAVEAVGLLLVLRQNRAPVGWAVTKRVHHLVKPRIVADLWGSFDFCLLADVVWARARK